MPSVLASCSGLPEATFGAGETLIPEGERTGRLFVLIEGHVEILKGDVPVYATAEPGAMFGEISALLDIPHTATVRTAGPSRLHVAEPAAEFLRSRPELAHFVSLMLAQRLYAMTSYLADLKAQFLDQSDHLSMVDEVLTTLLYHQDDFAPGSDRHPDRTL